MRTFAQGDVSFWVDAVEFLMRAGSVYIQVTESMDTDLTRRG